MPLSATGITLAGNVITVTTNSDFMRPVDVVIMSKRRSYSQLPSSSGQSCSSTGKCCRYMGQVALMVILQVQRQKASSIVHLVRTYTAYNCRSCIIKYGFLLKNYKNNPFLAKVLNLHCHCTGKRPDLCQSVIWNFSSCLTPLKQLHTISQPKTIKIMITVAQSDGSAFQQ